MSKQTRDIADSETPVTQLALNDRSGEKRNGGEYSRDESKQRSVSLSRALVWSFSCFLFKGPLRVPHVAFQMNSLPR